MSTKKDPKKKKTDEPPAPIDPTVDLKSLQAVTELLSKVKHLRNYFQLERDKVHKFWDISKKELENARFQLKNTDHELEEMAARHQVQMKVYRQKVRHLMYEFKIKLKDIQEKSDRELLEAAQLHQATVEELKREKQRLHQLLEASVAEHEEAVTAKREEHKFKIGNTKKADYERILKDTREEYQRRMATLRDELDLRRRAEIHEIEERKNEHINELIRLHEQKFADMKNYYNSITSNNLDLIRSLKEEIANMKKNDEHNENLMYDIEKENHHLSEPLEQAKREVAELQQRLHHYEKDKLSLSNTRSRLKALDAEYRRLQEDHAALQGKYGKVQQDRDAIKKKFEMALHDAMDVVNEQNTAMQQRLIEVNARVEERDAQLSSVLSAANLEPQALEAITRQLEDTIETKDRAIKDLHFELKKIQRQHRDVITEYERRCIASKVPPLDAAEVALGGPALPRRDESAMDVE